MNQFDYVSNAANGYGAQDILQNKLLALRRDGDLSIVVKKYRAGDPNAKNVDQFYAPFMIQFNNGSRWIVFSTTSCRTDRIKGQQWDADNLKRLDLSIEKAILTYPDEIDHTNKRAFIKQKEKYDKGFEISRLDDVIPNETLIKQIKQRSQDIFYEREYGERENDTTQIMQEFEDENATSSKITSSIFQSVGFANNQLALSDSTASGRAYDFNGKAFEVDVASLLSDSKYLHLIKSGADKTNDRKLACFISMIRTFAINPLDIVSIEATAQKEDIGLLPSGGQPKTDVWAKVFLAGGERRDVTISCKRTTKSSVSVHQYTADAFADVLAPDNNSLRTLLNLFQFCANAKNMPKGNKIALEEQLRSYLPQLCRWVLGGYGGEISSPIQYADYLVVYRPNDNYFGVHTIDEYTEKLLQRSPMAFGTPFGWTYASGQRGKSIQLKLPIIR